MALLNECAVCRYGYCVLIVARRHLVHMSVWSGSSLQVHLPAHRWQLKGRGRITCTPVDIFDEVACRILFLLPPRKCIT